MSQFLEDSSQRKFNPEHPSPAELRSYLLQSPRSGPDAQAAVSLLLRTESGRRALIQDAYTFSGKYSPGLAQAVKARPEATEVWSAFWRLPAQEGITLESGLRAEILAYSKDLSAKDLFSDFSILRTDADLRDLELYEDRLETRRPELSQEIKNVRLHLDRCVRPDLDPRADCSLEGISPEGARFIQRVKVQWLVRSFETSNARPTEFIDRLRRIPLEKGRTPALHEALIQVIDRASADAAETEAITRSENFQLFQLFSQHDRLLGHRWVSLLVKQAEVEFRADHLDQSLALLEESFKAVAEPVEARIGFLNTIVYSETWKNRADIQQRFRNVVRRGVPARPWYELNKEKLVGIFGILASLSFVWMTYVYFYRLRKAEEERAALAAEMTALGEREELRLLREFFEISPLDGEAELLKSYRKKAKETHPDLFGGATQKFQEVQDKYQRARELLGRPPKL